MKLILALLLALTLGASPRAEDPAPSTVTCPTCEGEGSAIQDCVSCVAGDVTCAACAWEDLTNSTEFVFSTNEDITAEVFLKLYEHQLMLLDLQKDLALNSAGIGRVSCPAGCKDGIAPKLEKKCKFCKGKGSFPCKYCSRSSGKQTCIRCEGRGRVQRQCEDCLGSGLLPDPAARIDSDVDLCEWCDTSGVRACTECDEKGECKRTCTTCVGSKTIECWQCLGTTKRACETCYATGKQRRSGGSKTKPCKTCKQKGKVDCSACDKGRLECRSCKGIGERVTKCLYCLGDHERTCQGCFRGQYRQWELSAQLSEAADDYDRAIWLIDHAIRRTELRYKTRLEWLVGDAEVKRRAKLDLEARRNAERDRLELRLESLRVRARE